MSWLSQLFKGENPIESAGKALDNLFTSDEERLQGQAVLTELEGKLEVVLQEAMTERWKADMASDSWLSKNVRPMMWIASGGVFFGLALGSLAITVPEFTLSYAFQAFTAISGMYIVARETGKGIVNWKKK